VGPAVAAHDGHGADALIDRIGAAEGVNPAIIRGIIAAESDGNPRLEAASGYKGLMQAERDRGQFDPETSIRTGTIKYRNFRDRYLGPPLARLGVDLRRVDEDTAVRWVMTAYNAGQRTVLKAVEYAQAAGDHRQWMAADHMQRALVHTSAYSVATALRGPLRALSADALARELAALTRQPVDALRGRSADALRLAIVRHVEGERLALRGRDLPMADVRRRASPRLLESVEFKHRNQPRYVDRVIAYKRYFQAR
jgi:Transglycosylase SLT domain